MYKMRDHACGWGCGDKKKARREDTQGHDRKNIKEISGINISFSLSLSSSLYLSLSLSLSVCKMLTDIQQRLIITPLW